MDIATVILLIFIMVWMVYMTLGFHARQRRLEFRMDGLEEQIKRELNSSFQQITNARLIATTVDARTDKFPSFMDGHQELTKRISKIESEMSGVNTTLEYMKLLKSKIATIEKDLAIAKTSTEALAKELRQTVHYLEQTTGGVAKASMEMKETYDFIITNITTERKQNE